MNCTQYQLLNVMHIRLCLIRLIGKVQGQPDISIIIFIFWKINQVVTFSISRNNIFKYWIYVDTGHDYRYTYVVTPSLYSQATCLLCITGLVNRSSLDFRASRTFFLRSLILGKHSKGVDGWVVKNIFQCIHQLSARNRSFTR